MQVETNNKEESSLKSKTSSEQELAFKEKNKLIERAEQQLANTIRKQNLVLVNTKETNKYKNIAFLSKLNNKKKKVVYPFGNYPKFHYRRYLQCIEDAYCPIFKPEYFENKKVLDIGSNEGVLSILLAYRHNMSSLIGIDLDAKLVLKAYKNLNLFQNNLKLKQSIKGEIANNNNVIDDIVVTDDCNYNYNNYDFCNLNINKDNQNLALNELSNEELIYKLKTLPISCTQKYKSEYEISKNIILTSDNLHESVKNKNRNCYNINNTSVKDSKLQGKNSKSKQNQKPKVITELNNELAVLPNIPEIIFKIGNFLTYDFKDEVYDVITCFSVLKWIHLNYGDEGILVAFYKIWKLLKPNGLFILEIEAFKSYNKRKELTENTLYTYNNIRVKPSDFKDFLIDQEYFEVVEEIDCCNDNKKGYKRPIIVFRKIN